MASGDSGTERGILNVVILNESSFLLGVDGFYLHSVWSRISDSRLQCSSLLTVLGFTFVFGGTVSLGRYLLTVRGYVSVGRFFSRDGSTVQSHGANLVV